MFGEMGKSVMKQWSVTQNLTFKEQLEHGIRYFDLRVASKKHQDDLRYLHSLYGPSVKDSLQEIQTFLDSHPKEVVILDFNHFYEMNEKHHENLIELVTDKFESKMCPHLDMDSVTLSMMWESGLQVIVFYQNNFIRDNMMFWPASSIKAPWANTADIHDLMTFLDSRFKSGRPLDEFHVTQGVITPGTGMIMSHLNSSLQAMTEKVAPRIVVWLKDKKIGSQGINICMIDFVEKADFISNVISLNI